MKKKYNAFIVVLEKDIRQDDAEATINAIKQIKGVLSVKGNVSNIDEHLAETRMKYELIDKIFQILE